MMEYQKDFDKWCRDYIEANSDIMPMDSDLKTLAPYCHLYKGDSHFNQMGSILNGDPEYIAEAVRQAGHEYEEMYQIVDHGLFADLEKKIEKMSGSGSGKGKSGINTGDETMIVLWVSFFGAALILLAILIIKRIRSRR